MVPSQDELKQLHASICAGLADPTRIAILYALHERDCTVSELVAALGLPQSTVSRHLAVLRATNLARMVRVGRNSVYQLTDTRVIAALDLIRAVMQARVTHFAAALNNPELDSASPPVQPSPRGL